MSTEPYCFGCQVTLRMSPSAARAMAEELLLLARESEKQGKLCEFTIGGEDPPAEGP